MNLFTERLILRPWEEEDAPSLFEFAADPRIGPAAGWPVHKDVEFSLETIRTVLAAPETYAVCLREDNRAIGSIGLKMGKTTNLTDRPDEAEIGYWIGVPFWGRELIPEAVRELQRHAFEDLGIKVLWCGYYDGNEKSRRVQEKCGFQYHHTTQEQEVSLLNEIRTEHVTRLSLEMWKEQN